VVMTQPATINPMMATRNGPMSVRKAILSISPYPSIRQFAEQGYFLSRP
jgi:hypothetical protein